ncbi:alpha/beta hydrolase [Micromonospora sp. NPDC005707]|uniref:esterase/lipase family protein n=1 Tax=Micromonospora sp. NPDC005707 TaxID=3157050 RepID=UPI0033C4E954
MLDADAVFVHGLWSSSDTWRPLAQRITSDPELIGLRLRYFDYPSPKLSPRVTPRRVPGFRDLGQLFATYLRAQVGRRPAVIVTHSQGGLVVQRFLAWMLNEGRGQELAHIRAIAMLACPHDGSNYMYRVRQLLNLRRHPQIRDLETLNIDVNDAQRVVLRQVVFATQTTSRDCPIPVYVYAGAEDRIVPPASAQGNFPQVEMLAGDHFTVLRPDDGGYLTFPSLKQMMLDHLGVREGQPTDPSPRSLKRKPEQDAEPGRGGDSSQPPRASVSISNCHNFIMGSQGTMWVHGR